MAFALGKEQAAFIDRMISLGRFNNQSEVVREAMRRLQRAELEDYLRPPPITATEARRVYRRTAPWERVERALAGRAKPE